MKLQISSDLHLNFHADDGKSLLEELYASSKEAESLCIAGDLSDFNTLERSIRLVKKVYKDKKVIFVPGNHDYYHGSVRKTHNLLKKLEKELNRFIFINNEIKNIDGVRFIGAPLWFAHTPYEELYKGNLADFSYIEDFDPWVFSEHYYTVDYFNLALNPDTVVITHHIPSYLSVADEYKNSFLNRFFVTDQSNLILDRKPKIWIHGHTHSCFDYVLGDTRVICNPFGYPSENKSFNPSLIIDV